MKLSSIK